MAIPAAAWIASLLFANTAFGATLVDTYAPIPPRGWALVQFDPTRTNFYLGRALEFETGSVGAIFESVELPLNLIDGPNEIDIQLREVGPVYPPNGNISPGTIIETMRLSGTMTNGLSTVQAFSTLRPTLAPDTSYFLAVATPVRGQLHTVGWGAGNPSDSGSVLASEWYTGEWVPIASTSVPRSAMRIHVTEVPEPGTGWLVATGLAALGARRSQAAKRTRA